MKRHLTEDELIQHLFELTPDASQSEFAAHLKDCSDCRERLEKLRRRFASLDLIAGDIELSEELISKVLAVAEEPPARSQWFRLPVWIGSAAAVLVVAALFMVSSEQRVPEPSSVATRFAKEESEHADRDIERERKVLAEKEFSAGELAAKPQDWRARLLYRKEAAPPYAESQPVPRVRCRRNLLSRRPVP